MLSNICSYVWCSSIINKSSRNSECQHRRWYAEHRKSSYIDKVEITKGLGVIRKRKLQAILHTRRYKIHTEPEKYYHAKLLLYYPWNEEDDILSTYISYHDSYTSKQDIIHQNVQKFNEECVAFDIDLQDLENNIPQSAWEIVAPNIAQDDRTTNV